MIHGRWTGYVKSDLCDRMFFGKLSVILADGVSGGFCINLKLHKENVMWTPGGALCIMFKNHVRS